jgi:hypothetical protein
MRARAVSFAAGAAMCAAVAAAQCPGPAPTSVATYTTYMDTFTGGSLPQPSGFCGNANPGSALWYNAGTTPQSGTCHAPVDAPAGVQWTASSANSAPYPGGNGVCGYSGSLTNPSYTWSPDN